VPYREAVAEQRVRLLALVASFVLLPCLAVPVAAVAAGADTAARPITVPLHLQPGSGVGAPGGAVPTIDIGVGTNRAVPVLFDTGSLGLHMYSAGIRTGPGSGVTLTSTPFTYAFINGVQLSGVLGRAKLAIGSLQTTGAVPIGVVQHFGCVASRPNCPKRTMAGRIRGGIYGIVGLRTDRPAGPGVPGNPLRSLPDVSSWSIHFGGSSGTLVLRAVPAAGASIMPMQSEGSDFWKDESTVCITVGSSTPVCTGTLFDSGEPDPIFFRGELAALVPARRHVALPGTPIRLAAPGRPPFLTFTTGTTPSYDLLRLGGIGHSSVNTSIVAFYAATVTYNVVAGTVAVAPNGPR
jgi:hypothetical protein